MIGTCDTYLEMGRRCQDPRTIQKDHFQVLSIRHSCNLLICDFPECQFNCTKMRNHQDGLPIFCFHQYIMTMVIFLSAVPSLWRLAISVIQYLFAPCRVWSLTSSSWCLYLGVLQLVVEVTSTTSIIANCPSLTLYCRISYYIYIYIT